MLEIKQILEFKEALSEKRNARQTSTLNIRVKLREGETWEIQRSNEYYTGNEESLNRNSNPAQFSLSAGAFDKLT